MRVPAEEAICSSSAHSGRPRRPRWRTRYARHMAAAPPAAELAAALTAEPEPGDAEAAAPMTEPAGREILYDLNSDDSSSDDDDDE
eukprot:7384104-Prymnesium_polylepis.1